MHLKKMGKERLRLYWAISIFALLCATYACYAEESLPQRIISLGPSLTEQLYILEVQDRLIGCTIYCESPKEMEDKEIVATAINVNVEKVVGPSLLGLVQRQPEIARLCHRRGPLRVNRIIGRKLGNSAHS